MNSVIVSHFGVMLGKTGATTRLEPVEGLTVAVRAIEGPGGKWSVNPADRALR
jgi:hypothetical protein